MKKWIFSFILCLGAAAGFAQEAQQVEFALFVSPTCVHCNKLKREYWPKLKEKYKDTVHFTEYDLSVDGNHLVFMETAKAYGKTEGLGYPAAVVGETFLMGYPTEIGTYAEAAIERALQSGKATDVRLGAGTREEAEKAFKKFTFWAIVAAGLVDGINPCAFAVIVFFISFLTVYKYTRREIMLVGTAYCFAVFCAYLLLGFGLFNAVLAMTGFSYITKVFYILTAGVCLLFFVLSVYDFVIYSKTKKADGMLLQLPHALKVRIHKIMGFFLRDKNKSTLRLTLAALAVGFCVSLVEAVCTGQVYVPTCMLILQEPAFRTRAMFYLVLYNLMFMIPLVVVFVLALLGYESKGFNDFFKKHLGLAKLLLCVIFLALFVALTGNI